MLFLFGNEKNDTAKLKHFMNITMLFKKIFLKKQYFMFSNYKNILFCSKMLLYVCLFLSRIFCK